MDFFRTLSYLLQLDKINQKVSFYKIASEASHLILTPFNLMLLGQNYFLLLVIGSNMHFYPLLLGQKSSFTSNVFEKVITWKDDSCRVCCHNENEWNYEPFQVCHFDISSCCSLLAFSRQATNFQQPKEPVFFSKRGRQSTQWEFIMSWFFICSQN